MTAGAKVHFLYYIEHLPSGRYYLGRCSALSLDTKYRGSGAVWKKILAKYPVCEFEMSVLSLHDSQEELIEAERILIKREYLEDPLCMNLIPGGAGGDNERFYKHQTPTEIAIKGANTLKSNPEKLRARNQKIAQKQTLHAAKVGVQKAELMRTKITAESRKLQGRALSASSNKRMDAFYQALKAHEHKQVHEIHTIFPSISKASIRRGLQKLKNKQETW
jgi:hypothetical protein